MHMHSFIKYCTGICQKETKELDCGENRVIQIEEGTNYGHLDTTTCIESTTTGSNQNSANNAVRGNAWGNAATTSTELPAAYATTTISPIDTTSISTTEGVGTLEPITTPNDYTPCYGESSREKVEDL